MIDKKDFASLFMLSQVRTESMEAYAKQIFEARFNASLERVMKKQVMVSGLPPAIDGAALGEQEQRGIS